MRYHYDEEELKHLNKQQLAALERNELYRASELFQELQPGDEKDYRQYARDYFKPESELDPLWHPCMINECIKIINKFYNEEKEF
jgi:hypothetical protein